VTDDDLRRALLDHEPEIVHFSGHGTGRRGLVFEEAGEPLFIAGDALAGLLGLCSSHVKCVVLNACYSEVQAMSISSVVDFVIGMSRAIGDIAAIRFSTGFYDALASRRSYTDAFRFGCNAISLRGIPESLTPTLIVKNHVQSGENLASADKISECKSANIRQIDKSRDPSIQELISILDFRADMILSETEKDKREVLELGAVAQKVSTGLNRDMKIRDLVIYLDMFANRVAQLHEQNKKALIDRQLLLSHEITSKIHDLLSERRDAVIYWHAYESPKRVPHTQYKLHYPPPWTFASDYPGPLPRALTDRPNEIVLLWRREEEERRRAEERAEGRPLPVIPAVIPRNKRQIIMAAQKAAMTKGILRKGDCCPHCRFSHAWDGIYCHYCHYKKG
jgi:hypothetical protein